MDSRNNKDWEIIYRMNRDWRCTYIVKKGIIRRVWGYKCLKAPVKMKKKKSINHKFIWQDKVQCSGATDYPKHTENVYSSMWIARQWKIPVSCWTYFIVFQSFTEKHFLAPSWKTCLNKNNGSGCHQLFSLKDKERSCTYSCQHVSSRYNFEIVGGVRAARPSLSNSLPKTYSDGAVSEMTVTEQKHLKVAHMKVGYLAHFLPTVSYSLLFCMGNGGV